MILDPTNPDEDVVHPDMAASRGGADIQILGAAARRKLVVADAVGGTGVVMEPLLRGVASGVEKKTAANYALFRSVVNRTLVIGIGTDDILGGGLYA